MGELLHGDVTERILGAAFEVHRGLGPGFLEAVYEKALAHALTRRGVHFQRQVEVPVLFGGVEVGRHRVDLIVEEKVIVELKCVTDFAEIHSAVLHSYLKATGLQVGLLLNFAATSLQKKRVANKTQSQ